MERCNVTKFLSYLFWHSSWVGIGIITPMVKMRKLKIKSLLLKTAPLNKRIYLIFIYSLTTTFSPPPPPHPRPIHRNQLVSPKKKIFCLFVFVFRKKIFVLFAFFSGTTKKLKTQQALNKYSLTELIWNRVDQQQKTQGKKLLFSMYDGLIKEI